MASNPYQPPEVTATASSSEQQSRSGLFTSSFLEIMGLLIIAFFFATVIVGIVVFTSLVLFDPRS